MTNLESLQRILLVELEKQRTLTGLTVMDHRITSESVGSRSLDDIYRLHGEDDDVELAPKKGRLRRQADNKLNRLCRKLDKLALD